MGRSWGKWCMTKVHCMKFSKRFCLNQASLDLKNSSIENGGGLQAPAHAKELTAVDGCWERKDHSLNRIWILVCFHDPLDGPSPGVYGFY